MFVTRRVGSARLSTSAGAPLLRRARTAGLILFALLLISPPAANATFPGNNGRIAFASARDGNYEIYTMKPDGSGLADLTQHPADDEHPAWSPDGNRIAFESDRSGTYDIWVMNADGTGLTNLTNTSSVYESEATWSPDGTKLAYLRSANSDIYVMNADGSGQIDISNDSRLDRTPSWSPDGSKIAFASAVIAPGNNNYEIYTMNPDGTGKLAITSNTVFDFWPNWSPDGQKIAFGAELVDPNYEIYSMNADGSARTNISQRASSYEQDPAWSPDGSKIVYSSNLDGNYEIYAMNPDGTGNVRLTNYPSLDAEPDWGRFSQFQTPAGAPLVRDFMVPSFKPCGTPGNPGTGDHAAPLSSSSCAPVPTAAVARVGSQSVSSATLSVIKGDPTTTANEADIAYSADAIDIRAGSTTGPDYDPNQNTTDLTIVARLRITDANNGPSQTDPATTTDFDLLVPVNCAITPDPSIGASCSGHTSANAVSPGFIVEGRHTIVQTFRVRVNDSGQNGIRGDGDDSLFLMGGTYVP